MNEYEYKVVVDNKVYARDMDLQTALTLTEALFNKWHGETNLAITIEREDFSVRMSEDKVRLEVTK